MDILFIFATCKCSLRTCEEEEELGSYCSNCWQYVKMYMKCVMCDKSVEKERLYVSAQYNVPACRSCFQSPLFKLVMALKGFAPIK